MSDQSFPTDVDWDRIQREGLLGINPEQVEINLMEIMGGAGLDPGLFTQITEILDHPFPLSMIEGKELSDKLDAAVRKAAIEYVIFQGMVAQRAHRPIREVLEICTETIETFRKAVKEMPSRFLALPREGDEVAK